MLYMETLVSPAVETSTSDVEAEFDARRASMAAALVRLASNTTFAAANIFATAAETLRKPRSETTGLYSLRPSQYAPFIIPTAADWHGHSWPKSA